MDIPKDFNNNYGKWFITDVIRAITHYGLIETGEEICVALSGGRDSATLLYILWYLKTYSHLDFNLCALHVLIDDYDTKSLSELCAELGVEYLESRLSVGKCTPAKNVCSICSHLKRGAMIEALKGTGIRKVAFGHHADDVAETLFMNIAFNRKLGSFTPKVEIPEGEIIIIRPLVYLDGPLIKRLHTYFKLPVVLYICPYEDISMRQSMRTAISRIEEQLEMKDFSRMVVSALENVDLSNMWMNLQDK